MFAFQLSKRTIIYSASTIAGLLLVGLFAWGLPTFNKPPIVPEEVLNKGIQATLSANSFQFKLQYKTKADKEAEILSDIKGQKVGTDQIHITGKMLKTPVDIYQLKDKTLIKNSIGSWTVLDENDIHQQELLVNEVNPLSIFAFKEIPEVKYIKTEEYKGEEYYVISYRPNIANQFLEVLATDFLYTSWVHTETNLVGKTVVEATSKGKGKGKLLISLEFWDYNENLKIEPPEVN